MFFLSFFLQRDAYKKSKKHIVLIFTNYGNKAASQRCIIFIDLTLPKTFYNHQKGNNIAVLYNARNFRDGDR